MWNKQQIKEVLGMDRMSWFYLIQLEHQPKHWLKRNGKCKDLMTYEETGLQKLSLGDNKVIKGALH